MALTGQQVIHDLRATLFAHLLKLEAGFFDRTPVGRLMTRVLSDVEAVSEAFTSGIFAIVADVVTLVGVVAIMLWMDWRLALVTYAIVPVLFGVAGYLRIRARDAYREVRRRLARLNAFLQESIQGMSVIQLFGREEHERRQFERLNQDYRRAQFASTGSRPRSTPRWRRWARWRWRSCSGTAAGRSSPARSRSAGSWRSSSTPTASSCPSGTSARSTR